jgi:hypothetical protein
VILLLQAEISNPTKAQIKKHRRLKGLEDGGFHQTQAGRRNVKPLDMDMRGQEPPRSLRKTNDGFVGGTPKKIR